MSYPPALHEMIELFEALSEPERREMLISYAEEADSFRRREGEDYDFADVRKDEQCTDAVGIYVQVDDHQRVRFAIELGPKVQTLTRALTVILCRGLSGCTVEEVLKVSPDFVPRLIGADLVRLRSRTVYYILDRMKEAAQSLLTRD